MRIALIVERFEPAAGGAEQIVWNTAAALASCGEEVHVFARSGSPAAGVTLHALAGPTFWQPARVASFARRTRRATSTGDFDAVHSFCRTPRQHVFHALGGSHADYLEACHDSRGARLRRASPRHALQLALERRILRDSTQIIQCGSRVVRDQLIRRYGLPTERARVLYCGIDATRFDPTHRGAARKTLREELGAGDATVWLFAGSGWQRKGLDTALQALARTRSHDSRLWIAGRHEGARWEERARVMGVAHRVHFLGVRDDMEALYAAADGLLHPARYEPFGLVCLEAAASGIPVVTSARAGAGELVANAGRVVTDPEDAPAFARALDALQDGELRKRLGDEGRRIARGHSWQRFAEGLRELSSEVRDARERAAS